MCEEREDRNKSVLYGKMAAVMGSLSRVKESGKHIQGWKYATSEDIKDAVRVAMSEQGLALLPNLKSHEIISLDKGMLVRGTMEFTICCSETGETVTRQLVGEATDQSKVSDKAFYKLYTTLTKYFLRTTFLISSGEELDSDSDGSTPRNKGNMNLTKLLANLNKVERITGFYNPSSIMACRSKGSEPPAPDDIEGWRQLYVDARNYAFKQLDQSAEEGKTLQTDLRISGSEWIAEEDGNITEIKDEPF